MWPCCKIYTGGAKLLLIYNIFTIYMYTGGALAPSDLQYIYRRSEAPSDLQYIYSIWYTGGALAPSDLQYIHRRSFSSFRFTIYLQYTCIQEERSSFRFTIYLQYTCIQEELLNDMGAHTTYIAQTDTQRPSRLTTSYCR